MNNLLNILANSNKDIDNQLLMDYISGRLSNADQHAVEEWLEENQFAADALEGLQQFGNQDQLQEYVVQLNRELKQYLAQKKQRRDTRYWKDKHWTYTAIIFILLVIIIAFVMIRMLSGNTGN